MQYLFANNAASTLASGASLVASTLTVATGHGSRFPSPGPGQGFVATIQNGAAYEIVLCTSRAGDVLTVQRAQDGTLAQTWASGSSVDLRVPKAVLDNFSQKDATLASTGGTMTGVLLLDDSASLTSPPLAFDGDGNTGLAHPAADTASVVTAGGERIRVTTTAVESMVPVLVPVGSAGAPSITFTGDTDTGFFRPGADSISAVLGSTVVFTLDSKGATVTGEFEAVGPLVSTFDSVEVLRTTKDGANINGDLAVTGDLTVSGDAAVDGSILATAALEAKAEVLSGTFVKAATYLEAGTPGTTGNRAVLYSQFPTSLGASGQFALPGGVIVKWGTGSTTLGEGEVTFGTAFPTACDNVHLTLRGASVPHGGVSPVAVGADISVTGFSVYGKTTETLSFFWVAFGR
jgi:hypothetical protein